MVKFLGLVPGWAWALALAGALAGIVMLTLQLSASRLQTSEAKREAEQLRTQIERERGEHQRALAEETTRVLGAERSLRAARAEQERKDGDAQATIADLGEQLRRRAAAGGLRDPFAAPCHREPAPGSGPAAAAGGEDRAEAGRALSAQFSGAVVALLAEADDINAAYASCRADAVALRLQLRQLSPPPGQASAGSP